MNKLFTKIAALALGATMAVGIGVAVASSSKEATSVHAEETVYKHMVFSSTNNSKGVSSYSNSWTNTTDSFTWNLANWNNNNNGWTYIKAGNKNTAYVATIENASAASVIVTKVDVEIGAVTASAINSVTLFYGTSANPSTNATSVTISAATQTITIPEAKRAANMYYRLEVDCKASKNGTFQLNDFKLYYNASTPLTGIALSGTGVSGSNPNYTYNIASSSDTNQKTVTVGLNPTTATDQVVKVEHYSGTSGLLTFDSTVTCTSGSGSFHFTGKGNSGTEKFKLYGKTETSVISYLEVSVGTYYTVTFNSDGGSSTPPAQSVEDGSTFTFPSAGTKAHHTFLGWSSDGGTTNYATGATSPAVTGAITYTAYWQEDAKVTVTYSAGTHGTGTYSHTNQYVGSYSLLAFANLTGISADTGYQFDDYTVDGVDKNPGDSITLSAATTVTVNFEEKPLEYQITFGTAEGTSGITSFSNTAYVIPSGVTLNNIQGNIYSNTSNQAASLRFGKSGTTGSFDATITGNYYIVSVKCNLKYYGSDSTATFAVTPNGGSAVSKSLTGSWADYTYDVSSAKATKVTLGTDVNGKRAYLSGFTITYAALPELDSVTTSGQKVTFSAGEKFSYGGTLTAHYTKGKADATVTPTSYKVGASGINPTSAGTAITAATTMTIDDHNGQYIYVVYTEDNITKWASYQITVNPAAPTGIELSSSSATIGIDDTFSFTDVEVTINPSEYATQNAYEWVMVDDLGLDVEFDYPDIVVHEDSNGEPLIIRCRSTVDNSVYADFELTVSGNPIAVLYDENDDDVTSGSASYYADYGNDIYYHVSATNFGTNVTYTWSSSNTSILSVDDEDSASCGYYIEDGASGTARLSCVVSGSKGSATVYVDVTITAVSVSSVTWSAPTIDVFSGATLSASDTSSWNVKYSTNSGKTGLTPDSFNVKLGGSTISLPHTWVAADHNKTLCVEVGGVSSSTTTVVVTQSINNVYAESFSSNSSDLTFTEACGGSGTADDSKAWTVTSDGTESNYDSNKGIHYGTGSAAVQYIKLTSGDFTSGKITKVEVNASTASGVSATVSVTVGGEAFGGDPQDLTSSAVPDNPYTFTGNVDADTIEVLITKPSSATKAIYCKSVVVTYETSSGSQNIANNASHKAAQRVAVAFAQAFNAAMDDTENCTTGLDAAWTTCSNAYNTFKTQAAALGSTEEAWAKNLVKYATVQWSDDSGEACIERMMKTYEVCVQKHGKTAFMSDLVTLGRASNTNPITIIGNKSDVNVIAIVVITSVVSLTAIGGYFFLRKRKENI